MFRRGVAVFAVTRQGAETAAKIRDVLDSKQIDCKIFVSKKYVTKDAVPIEKKLVEAVKDVFNKVDAVVAVMAMGIAVRAVAPLLQSKLSDPAVVCVDVSGRYVISLLSGHYGGANELTKLVANGLGAVPVITTASDVLGKQSVDELARTTRCMIVNPESLVDVNSALVNGEELVLVLVGNVHIPLTKTGDYEIRAADTIEQAVKIVNSFDAGAIITKEKIVLDGLEKPATVLKPKTVAVGIGSRKNVSENDIMEIVSNALKQCNIPIERVDRLATVDIKKDSLSMKKTAQKMGLHLEYISVDELRAFKHEDLSADSEFVKEKIGVGGVCERVALIVAGKKAKLIVKKTKGKGVTAALAEGE